MAEQWVSIAEAAAAMKIHPRTVERRAAAGKLEARRNDDGQVQVFLDMPEAESARIPHETAPNEAFETVKEMADRQVDIAAGSASALVRAAQEQTMRAEHQLELAKQESGRYRREAQMALALVACTFLCVMVAVGWCTHTITDARDRAAAAELASKNTSIELVHATDQLTQVNEKLNLTSDKLVQATVDRANAQGELTAYKQGVTAVVEQTRPHPATQPVTWFGRVWQASIGD